ncbi:response regulator receiver domain [Winogradskyella endarachnes]|uniref:Response receiver domain-containing protein n=1 Tax=Winogradskyella endarachnes TaxID=2681965 RepID=A0A6L6UCM9_9FLAO|nr:response regulator receiver domain [Winogradskyella endarachnes]MUU79276.1 hypothetical protein [Winogradskyella endarachnes]
MSYQRQAIGIIKESIKSAVFIDENARGFFQNQDELKGEREEEISIELFNNFKENGISLAIHQYKIDDEKNENLKNYLFEDRDLVLLDWNLDGNDSGQDISLQLLSDIIKRPHIHFCTIYTSESGSKIDNVFMNILSYFSGENKQFYDELYEDLEDEEEIIALKDALNYINVNRDSVDCGKKIGALFQSNRTEIKKIQEITKLSNKKCAIIKASNALNRTLAPIESHSCPSVVNFVNKTLVIDNTIISILNKDENSPADLINNISNQIIQGKTSFTQLLGLEMQSIFSKSGAFIDENILDFGKDAIIFHREKYRMDGHLHYFPEFIKEIMLEKAKLNIRNKSISLLDNIFLDNQNEGKTPSDKELIAMNVFYNSTKLKNDNKLNFGDVFRKKDSKDYFICVTALCDCLRPEKIENKFFFAKGEPIKKENALQLGDTAFVSYLSDKQIVKWTDVIPSADNLHKYSPVYIKPLQYTILNTEFEDNYITFKSINSVGEIDTFRGEYVTTIKSNYTQRIANHAFNHPIRVGVDFVKK